MTERPETPRTLNRKRPEGICANCGHSGGLHYGPEGVCVADCKSLNPLIQCGCQEFALLSQPAPAQTTAAIEELEEISKAISELEFRRAKLRQSSAPQSDSATVLGCPRPHPAQTMTWQPIETAPRDGTEVLLFQSGLMEHGSWKFLENSEFDGVACYGWETDFGHMDDPTHWRPAIGVPSAARQEDEP